MESCIIFQPPIYYQFCSSNQDNALQASIFVLNSIGYYRTSALGLVVQLAGICNFFKMEEIFYTASNILCLYNPGGDSLEELAKF